MRECSARYRFLACAGAVVMLGLGPDKLHGNDSQSSLVEQHAVVPRTAWERLRTSMIFHYKPWFGLRPTREAAAGVRIVADVPYGPRPAQKADLYLPDQDGFPVVVFVHGGAWISEDKIYYGAIGQFLAENGVGAIVIGYRLPPQVDCDGELRDVAAAFAWAHRHGVDYGGDVRRVFLSGHSAGGHLVAVVATNPCYLAAEGLTRDDVRGVIAFSGFYEIGVNVGVAGVEYVFAGMDKRAVSPAKQVDPGLPPFLLVCAAHETIAMRRPTLLFYRNLTQAGCQSELFVVPRGRHYGQVLDIDKPGRPQGARMLAFIREHQAK